MNSSARKFIVYAFKAASLLGLLSAISACGNPLGGKSSTVDPGHLPGVSIAPSVPPSRGSEFVSSSSQFKKTSGQRFVIQASLASPTNQVHRVSSQRGFQVFSNVQGEIISGDAK